MMSFPRPTPLTWFGKLVARQAGGLKEKLRSISRPFLALVVRGSGAGLAFVLNIVLARSLGSEGVGEYFQALTLITTLAVFARFGLDGTVLRFISAGAVTGGRAYVRRVYGFAMKLTLATALAGTIVIVVGAEWISNVLFGDPDLRWALVIMGIALAPLTIQTMHGPALQALGLPEKSVAVVSVLPPLFVIILLPTATHHFGLVGATLAYLISVLLTSVVGRHWWKKGITRVPAFTAGLMVSPRVMTKSCLPLFWGSLAMLAINWVPLLILGALGTSEEVGWYGLAYRTATVVSFISIAVNAATSSRLAAALAVSGSEAIARLLKRLALLSVIGAISIAVPIATFSEEILSFIGEEFIVASPALILLSTAYVVYVVGAIYAQFLVLSGREILSRNALAIAATSSVGLNLLLIPSFGVAGCALATGVSLCVYGVANAVYAAKALREFRL